jgi:anaerobic magnesium-protoporphyrin IX monomethyl ester cyclase
MKLLLVYLNQEYRPMVPLDLTCVEGYVKRGGHEVKIFDTSFYADILNLSDSKKKVQAGAYYGVDYSKYGVRIIERSMRDDFLLLVKDYQPDLIGFGVYSYTAKHADDLSMAVKKRFPDIPILHGGIHNTIRPEENIKKDWVDMICVGEGEMACLELCDAIEEGKTDFGNIENIWTKKNGKVRKMPLRQLIDLNVIPAPDWSSYRTYHQYGPIEGKVYKLALTEFTRGCPYSCTFCEGVQVKELSKKAEIGTYVRHKTPEKFIEDCGKLIDKYGIEFFYFVDGTFLSMPYSVLDKLAHLWSLQIKKPFLCLTTVSSITEKRVRLLKKMGCFQVNIGIESGSEKVRNDVYNKPKASNEKVIQSFCTLNKHNIRTSSFNIMGLPWENRADVFDTIELNRKSKALRTNMSIYIPYEGTPLTEKIRKMGYVDEETALGDESTATVKLCGDMTRDEIEGLYRTFALYCKVPKKLFPLLKACEKDNDNSKFVLEELKKIYIPNR